MESRTSSRRLIAADRRARVIELRKGGWTLTEIARQVGVSPQAVHKVLKSELARLNSLSLDLISEWKELEISRLDKLQASLWRKAVKGDLRAAETILSIIDRRARLMGLGLKVAPNSARSPPGQYSE